MKCVSAAVQSPMKYINLYKNINFSKTNIFPENLFDQAVHLHLTAKEKKKEHWASLR